MNTSGQGGGYEVSCAIKFVTVFIFAAFCIKISKNKVTNEKNNRNMLGGNENDR